MRNEEEENTILQNHDCSGGKKSTVISNHTLDPRETFFDQSNLDLYFDFLSLFVCVNSVDEEKNCLLLNLSKIIFNDTAR